MAMDNSNFIQRGFSYLEESKDFKSALSKVMQSLVTAVGSDSGSVYVLDREKAVLEPYVLVNFPPEYLEGCRCIELGQQCCGRAALHKIPWFVDDMLTDPLFRDCAEAANAAGLRSGFSVPVLTAEGDCLGTLGFQYRSPFTPSTHAIELVSAFCELIAVAISNETEKHNRGERKPPASVAVDGGMDERSERGQRG
jgi:GAF domain-containing protein